MALGEIDYGLKPQELELFLAKPNKTIIAKLTEAIDSKQQFRLGELNEITFSLPLVIDENHKLVRNTHVDMAKARYLVKAKLGAVSEWYRIEKIGDDGSDTERKTYTLYSLGIEISDKQIRGYSKTSINAQTALLDALSGTIWNTGYIDGDFLVKYRSFEVPQKSALDFVNQIAETFNALVIFDTENRTVSLYNPANIGSDKGLKVSYGRYLKSINKEYDATQIVTRLKAYGAEGMSIQRVNATGTTYVEDFSYFLYPFERDGLGAVIKSSDYMSDGLCGALLDYNTLLTTKQGEFATLLSQKAGFQTTLTVRQNELTTLQTELAIILDQLDVAQSTGQPTAAIITARDAKLAAIALKQGEVNAVQSSIDGVDADIVLLRAAIAITANFTTPHITELNQFVIEREWSDENYINDEELYEEAKKVLSTMNTPKSTIKIDIVNFKEIVTEQYNWDKLNLGDTITIYHERFNINVKARIIEMSVGYRTGSVDLVISDTRNIIDDEAAFRERLNMGVTASTTVDMNKFKWNGIDQATDDISLILNQVWDATARAIKAGVNNSVLIDRRGITITDPADSLRLVRITNSHIGVSNDGGNTFKSAVTPSGVIAETVMGKLILGNQISIGDENGNFDIVGNLLTIKDNQVTPVERVALGEYDVGKYGLRIKDKTGNTTILDEDGIMQTWQEGRADNVASGKPLNLNLYLPDSTKTIHSAILRFRRMAFRAYSTSASSGGGSSSTTGAGGATTPTTSSGGGTSTTTASGGATTPTTSSGGSTTISAKQMNNVDFLETLSNTSSAGSATIADHTHYITQLGDSTSGGGAHSIPAHTHTYWDRHWDVTGLDSHTHGVDIPSHTHSVSISSHEHGFSISNHTHSVDVPSHQHSVVIDSHTHSVTLGDHSHSFSVGSHTHGIVYGIYEGTLPAGVGIIINGVDRTTELGGLFNSDQSSLDISSYLLIGQWNTIDITSTQLGRIDGTIFVQAKMGI